MTSQGGRKQKTGRHLVTRLGRHPVSSRRCSAAVGRKEGSDADAKSIKAPRLADFLNLFDLGRRLEKCAFMCLQKLQEVA